MAEADGDRRRPADGTPEAGGPEVNGPGTPGANEPGATGLGATGLGASRASGPGAEAPEELLSLSTEERAVRELLHGAVSGIQPAAGGLPRIRRAVPRRRAARRGAWTGAAALAFVVAIGLPVLHEGEHLGLSGGPGSADAKSPAATSPSGTAGTTGGTGAASHANPSGPGDTTPPPGTASAPHSPGGGQASTDGGVAPSGTSGAGDGGIVPLCTRTDLGEGLAQVGTADGDGRIYGSFTVYNVSGRSCRLGGPGSVAVTAVSGGDRGRIRTADHAPGDPAAGLPAMDGEPPVLAPRAGYRVPFAWVPDQTCTGSGTLSTPSNSVNQVALRSDVPAAESGAPASVPTSEVSANPPASSSPSAGPTTAPSPTATPTGNPTTAPPAVTIAHTPAPGSPAAATATLPVACSGTVYRGGVQGLGGPAPQPSGSPTAR
ncbi:hypothetical protein ACFVXH_11465 [Kitasatospora sp. NPDC058184]|uniref:hypothetical protein n=1 Tax=Kitasatospora sp. NPDC058184 TaxID=3346370 RepID=UPI0036D9AA51